MSHSLSSLKGVCSMMWLLRGKLGVEAMARAGFSGLRVHRVVAGGQRMTIRRV